MRTEIRRLPREEGVPPIALRLWIPDDDPKALVLILHGMAEHIGRYDRLGRFLAGEGYLAAGYDHRGHGPDWPKEHLGCFAGRDGWQALLSDAGKAAAALKRLWPGVPFVLLGHSMGSFLAREYCLSRPDEPDALVLAGTGSYGRPISLAGRLLAALSPADRPAALVDKLAFSGNNKPFEPARTPCDWLTRDESEVDRYIADPLTGFIFTGRAYRDFFRGLTLLAGTSRLKKMDPDMPVLFLSGDRDPVGKTGKGVEKVEKSFESAGMKSVTCRLYPGARHEVFNETNRDEVMRDLVSWLDTL